MSNRYMAVLGTYVPPAIGLQSIMQVCGLFFIAMSLLQAAPGRAARSQILWRDPPWLWARYLSALASGEAA